MKEVTIITEFNNLRNLLRQSFYSLQIAFTGESLRNQALQKLLIAKGVISSEELAKGLSDEIQLANAAQAAPVEEKKPELILPNAAEVAKVAETRDETLPS